MKGLWKSRTFNSAIFLYVVLIVNIVVPFLTMPHLTRVFRPEAWGIYSFYLSLALWLTIIGEFGFGIHSSQQISSNRSNEKVLDLVVAKVLASRFIIYMSVIIALVIAYHLFLNDKNQLLLAISFILSLAQSANPIWYFQGMEDLSIVSISDVLLKILSLFLIFFFVKDAGDVWLALMIQAFVSLLSSLVGCYLMYRQRNFMLVGFREAIDYIREAKDAFMYKVFSNLYISSNTLLLGFLSTNAQVGFYGGSERLVKAGISTTHPITQVLFIKVASLGDRGDESIKIIKKGLKLSLAYAIVAVLITQLFADFIINLLFGDGYQGMVEILRVMIFLLPLNVIVGSLGVQLMMNRGYNREFNVYLLRSGILNLTLMYVLAKYFGALGAAVSILIAETYMVVNLIRFCNNKKLWG
ncbi:oligosaccharide flippase family protein [Deinococcus wulumuqiensis]|uniref:oligosaccharide flippase family protein n=1 Tax=Deinococcus wulumuqiensis TaxID=980427 RepID=UPI00242C464C|nr:oligosaccharide flippase family protein [Deinococcus wulumuqiensis]